MTPDAALELQRAFALIPPAAAGAERALLAAGAPFPLSLPAGQHGDRPSWTWSAPLFLTVAAAGLGLTLGYTEIGARGVIATQREERRGCLGRGLHWERGLGI